MIIGPKLDLVNRPLDCQHLHDHIARPVRQKFASNECFLDMLQPILKRKHVRVVDEQGKLTDFFQPIVHVSSLHSKLPQENQGVWSKKSIIMISTKY